MTAPVFVDALNLAYWTGEPPTLRVPLAVLLGLVAHGGAARLYFDASARHRLAHEAEAYARLARCSELCLEVPSGRHADGVMLQHARAQGACIVSRDRYRDYRRRYRRLIDDPARLFAGGVQDDRVRVPALGLDAALPATALAGCDTLEAVVAQCAGRAQPDHRST